MRKTEPLGPTILGNILAIFYTLLLLLQELRFFLFPPHKSPFPIISVGGISAGGTGKTPLTSAIIEALILDGYTPILFSRGYGRRSKECIILSPDESCTWESVGDEPAMLRSQHPQLWLAINGARTKALKQLLPILPPKAVGIMDDGFQHRALQRNCDIVTLPSTILQDQLIPIGRLREPLKALKRATMCVIFDGSQETLEKLATILPTTTTLLPATLEANQWVHALSGKRLNRLQGRTILFSGIARPERFVKSATPHCETIVETHIFEDHHPFSPQDYATLQTSPTDQWGTTEKDLHRFDRNNQEIMQNLYYLVVKINPEITENLMQHLTTEIRRYYA